MKITETQRKKGVVFSVVVYLGRDAHGKRVQRRVSASSKRELQRQIEDMKSAARRGESTPSARNTVGLFIDEWLEIKNDEVAHRTFASYTDVADTYLKPTLGKIRLRALQAEHVRRALWVWKGMPRRDTPKIRSVRRGRGSHREARFEADAYGERISARTERQVRDEIDQLRKLHEASATLSSRTVRYILTVLRIALNLAVRTGRLSHNPARAVKGPQISEPHTSVLSAEQFAHLLSFAQQTYGVRMRTALLAAAATGLRRGELCALKWADLDLNAGTLIVRGAVEVLRSIRGAKVEERLKIKSPKGEREAPTERTIAIPAILCEELRRWLLLQARRLGLKPNEIPATTPTSTPAALAGIQTRLGSDVHALIRASGLPHVRLHDLRHSYGSWLANAHVSSRVIQAQLRHRTAAMTNRYTKHVEAAQIEAAEALDRKLRGAIAQGKVDAKLTQSDGGATGHRSTKKRKSLAK